jgi:uncharacterized protein (TIGR02452 family)
MTNAIPQEKFLIPEAHAGYLFEFTKLDAAIDRVDWEIADTSPEKISNWSEKLVEIQQKFSKLACESHGCQPLQWPISYTEQKLQHARENLARVEKSIEAKGTTVPHQKFVGSLPVRSSNYSFASGSTTVLSTPTTPALNTLASTQTDFNSFQISKTAHVLPYRQLTVTETLDCLSYRLRNKQPYFMGEYNQLPPQIKSALNLALQGVANGKKITFAEADNRQKILAIECIKIPVALDEIIQRFDQAKEELALGIFNTLPNEIQNNIYRIYCKVKSISNDLDSAKTSFQSIDKIDIYDALEKAEAVRGYANGIQHKINQLQLTNKESYKIWQMYDGYPLSPNDIKDQRTGKKNILDNMAQQIIFAFGEVYPVEPQAEDDSPEALAKAYVNAYSFLYPFFLRYVPNLEMTNQIHWESMGKPSHVIPPELTDTERQEYRNDIMQETAQTLRWKAYFNSKGEQINLNFTPSIVSYRLKPVNEGSHRRNGNDITKIILDLKDCLEVAQDCTQRHLNPIVMIAGRNEAPDKNYQFKDGAQEANIYRRTGLSVPVMDAAWGKDFYPLNQAVLYVSEVPVFRGTEAKGYPYLDKPFETAFAIATVTDFNEKHTGHKKLDNVDTEALMPIEDTVITKNKFRSILEFAEQKNHNAVILVAFGRDFYQNPPKQIFEIAMELIAKEFPHSFEEVHFALIDDHTTGSQAYDPQINLAACRAAMERYREELSYIGATASL